ncbi:phage virion morphogenesis protein [Pseudomonas coleopterorum]|uniref:phage virion morphogenesis protein n=1 Tax=Pseudomonas coleopterorum TaxID=1605838 RepID=UPI002A69A733|nr:phage virion morphogenesis protein [Pseudomonas coleopterorum]MDY1045396.1 phage virion morphogenesis protein [Pseudomonas coleopterorum]
MRDELEVLEEWAGALLAKLEPGERRKLLGQVVRDLRRNQQRRIAAQKAPDGTAYAPHRRARGGLRGKRGRIRSQMFVKLRTARWMRTEVSAAGVTMGFVGRVGRIARAHQLGRGDGVGRQG